MFVIVIWFDVTHVGIFILQEPICDHLLNRWFGFFISSCISTSSNILASIRKFFYGYNTFCRQNSKKIKMFNYLLLCMNRARMYKNEHLAQPNMRVRHSIAKKIQLDFISCCAFGSFSHFMLTKHGILAAELYFWISPIAILLRIRLCSFTMYSFCEESIFKTALSGEHVWPKSYM